MIRQRKLKGVRYNPLTTQTLQEENDPQELVQQAALPLIGRINNYSEAVRKNALVLLANLTSDQLPADLLQLQDPQFIALLFARFEEESPVLLDVLLYAFSNLSSIVEGYADRLAEKGFFMKASALLTKTLEAKQAKLNTHGMLANTSMVLECVSEPIATKLDLTAIIEVAFEVCRRQQDPTAGMRLICSCSQISLENAVAIAKQEQLRPVLREVARGGQNSGARVLACDCLLNLMYRLADSLTKETEECVALVGEVFLQLANNCDPEAEFRDNFKEEQKKDKIETEDQDWVQAEGESSDQDDHLPAIQASKLAIWRKQALALEWVLEDLVDIFDEVDRKPSPIRKYLRSFIQPRLDKERIAKLAVSLLRDFGPEEQEVVDAIVGAAASLLALLGVKPIPEATIRSLQYSLKNQNHCQDSLRQRLMLLTPSHQTPQLLVSLLGRSLQRKDFDLTESVLEQVSQRMNAQKFKLPPDSVRAIGQLLIRCLMLAEQRVNMRALDTIFDVFCNQDYDLIFCELGLPRILEEGRALLRGRGKDQLSREVLADLEGFISYKREHGCK